MFFWNFIGDHHHHSRLCDSFVWFNWVRLSRTRVVDVSWYLCVMWFILDIRSWRKGKDHVLLSGPRGLRWDCCCGGRIPYYGRHCRTYVAEIRRKRHLRQWKHWSLSSVKRWQHSESQKIVWHGREDVDSRSPSTKLNFDDFGNSAETKPSVSLIHDFDSGLRRQNSSSG